MLYSLYNNSYIKIIIVILTNLLVVGATFDLLVLNHKLFNLKLRGFAMRIC